MNIIIIIIMDELYQVTIETMAVVLASLPIHHVRSNFIMMVSQEEQT